MRILLISLLVSFSSFAFSDESCRVDNKDSCFWLFSHVDSFTFDNDMFAHGNDDQNYTYGLAWNWGDKMARRHFFHTETTQNILFDVLGLSKGYENRTRYALQVGLTNFTPDALASRDVVDDDRPYASLVYVHSDIYKLLDERSSVGIGTTFGFLGISLGGEIQATWHRILRQVLDQDRPVNPEGWDNQISDGGELTAMLDISYHCKPPVRHSTIDAALSLDGAIGYYTFASFGGVMKVGRINKNIPAHDVSKLAKPISADDKLQLDGARIPRELFFFVGARQVFMFYNALLECQFRDSNFCLDDSEIRHDFYEWSFGVKFPFKKYFENTNMTISWHGRSKEHELEKARSHAWGSLTLEWIGD